MRIPFSGFSFSKRSRICAQDRHARVGPFDARLAARGEAEILDVTGNCVCDDRAHSYPPTGAATSTPAARASASARSVCSQVNSGSRRPKWPNAAVAL